MGHDTNLELIWASISRYEFAFRFARSLVISFPPSCSGMVMALAHFATNGRPTHQKEIFDISNRCASSYVYIYENANELHFCFFLLTGFFIPCMIHTAECSISNGFQNRDIHGGRHHDSFE
jgi:hypothetical protein